MVIIYIYIYIIYIGSGKTYTLFGKDNTKIEHKLGNYNEKTDTRGIMGRICHDIFAKFPSIEQKLDVVTSFYEVYQQRVRDLSRKFHPTMGGHASPTNTKKKFKTAGRRPSLSVLSSDNYEEEDMEVMDGTGGGVTIKHLCDWIVDSPETLADIYENGVVTLYIYIYIYIYIDGTERKPREQEQSSK